MSGDLSRRKLLIHKVNFNSAEYVTQWGCAFLEYVRFRIGFPGIMHTQTPIKKVANYKSFNFMMEWL